MSHRPTSLPRPRAVSPTPPRATARDHRRGPTADAFTLIELLTVIAIIGILASLLIPTVAACRRHALTTREVAAARQLMVAYHLHAGDHGGRLLALQEAGVTGTTNETGAVVSGITGLRWPHRLRPYLGDRFRATLYVNTQAEFYDEAAAANDYTLSLGPSFGLNGPFVGGDFSSFFKDPPIRHVAAAAAPARLIAFASAHSRALHEKSGYWRVASPAAGWPADDIPGIPADPALDAAYGWLAYRHGGRAAVAFLDGHVALHTNAQLRDMRLWSDLARRADNPDYAPAR